MKIKLLLASLLFSLAVSEIIVRAAGYRPILLNSELFVTGSSYRLKPSFSGEYAGHQVTTDAEGNRNVVGMEDPQTLLLGDSVVFGQGLADNETIASRLGVANIGVPGYSSWNELEALKQYLQNHEVKRVILIYVPNDLTFNNDHAGIGRGGSDVSPSRFHKFTAFVYSYLYTSFLIKDAVQRLTTNQQGHGLDWSAFDYSMEAVQKMNELLPLSVGIYRDIWFYHDPTSALDYEKRVSEALDRRGIKNFLIATHINDLKESQVKIGWNDPHPGPRAAELIAKDISKFLRTRGLIN